jgi:hypothetical protein
VGVGGGWGAGVCGSVAGERERERESFARGGGGGGMSSGYVQSRFFAESKIFADFSANAGRYGGISKPLVSQHG